MSKFPKKYFVSIKDKKYGDLMTVKKFKEAVKSGSFVDGDGHGQPVKRKLLNPFLIIHPSQVRSIPKDATHIMWYNK